MNNEIDLQICLAFMRTLPFYKKIVELVKKENDGEMVFSVLLQMSIECYITKCKDGDCPSFSEYAKDLYEELEK